MPDRRAGGSIPHVGKQPRSRTKSGKCEGNEVMPVRRDLHEAGGRTRKKDEGKYIKEV